MTTILSSLTSAELSDLKAKAKAAMPGEWELVPSTVHHGAYVCGPYGGDICDCYVMSKPGESSTLNGGTSRPVPFMGTQMDANASYIAAANPETILRLIDMVERQRDCLLLGLEDYGNGIPRAESRYRKAICEAHAADKDAALNAAASFVAVLKEPGEGEHIAVSVGGSLGWRDENMFLNASVSINAYIASND